MVTRRRNVEAPCHPSCQGHDPEPPEIRFEIRSEKTTRISFFFQQISATKNRTTPENSCYLLLTMLAKNAMLLSYSIEAFLPTCSKKSGSAQQATRKCLGSAIGRISGFNMIQPNRTTKSIRISPDLSIRSLDAAPTKRPSLLPTVTLPIVHDLTWPTCTGKPFSES